MAEKWIKDAIKRPGAFTKKAKARGMDVKEFASKTAEIGEEALSGKDSPALDSIIYTSSIIYSLIKNKSLFESSDIIRKSIKKGTAKSFFKNAI